MASVLAGLLAPLPLLLSLLAGPLLGAMLRLVGTAFGLCGQEDCSDWRYPGPPLLSYLALLALPIAVVTAVASLRRDARTSAAGLTIATMMVLTLLVFLASDAWLA